MRPQNASELHPAPSAPSQPQAEIRAQPAGSRKANLTADAFTFYEFDGVKRRCKFCM